LLGFLKQQTGFEWHIGYPKTDSHVWYRGDRRYLRDIFKEGFVSKSKEDCVQEYVVYNKPSIFIGGSKDAFSADKFTLPFGYRYVCHLPKICIEVGASAITLSDVTLSADRIVEIESEYELAAVGEMEPSDIMYGLPVVLGLFPLPIYAENPNYKLRELHVSVQIEAVCPHQDKKIQEHYREQKKLKIEHRVFTHDEAKEIHKLIDQGSTDLCIVKEGKTTTLSVSKDDDLEHATIIVHATENHKTPEDIVNEVQSRKRNRKNISSFFKPEVKNEDSEDGKENSAKNSMERKK
jgi:hypothetical protein